MTGQIIQVRFDKGYAFIRDEDGSEIFAHCTNFRHRDFDHLVGNERVEFDKVPDRVHVGKFGALDVVVIG